MTSKMGENLIKSLNGEKEEDYLKTVKIGKLG
jgi:hypothetical protein